MAVSDRFFMLILSRALSLSTTLPTAVILMLLGGLFVLRDEFSQLFSIFSLESLLLVMGVMLLAGVGICVVCTWFTVNRLVGYNRDKLYSV